MKSKQERRRKYLSRVEYDEEPSEPDRVGSLDDEEETKYPGDSQKCHYCDCKLELFLRAGNVRLGISKVIKF